MRIIEYSFPAITDGEYQGSKRVKKILFEGDTNKPSSLFLEVIKEAGYRTEWTTVDNHLTCQNDSYGYDQPQRDRLFPKIAYQLSVVDSIFNGELIGKNILDIGCGAKQETVESSRSFPGQFDPWLCRFLYKLGVNVIGIDVGDLSMERFTRHNLNLLESNSLGIFETGSFDMVHSSSLYTSPELQWRVEKEKDDGSLKAGKELVRVLKPQILRVLKDGGIYLFRETIKYLSDQCKPEYVEKNSPLEDLVPRELFEMK